MAAVTCIVTIIVWAARLEGRVDAAEQKIVDVKQEHAVAVQQFREDLQYIRTRIDEALAR